MFSRWKLRGRETVGSCPSLKFPAKHIGAGGSKARGVFHPMKTSKGKQPLFEGCDGSHHACEEQTVKSPQIKDTLAAGRSLPPIWDSEGKQMGKAVF